MCYYIPEFIQVSNGFGAAFAWTSEVRHALKFQGGRTEKMTVKIREQN